MGQHITAQLSVKGFGMILGVICLLPSVGGDTSSILTADNGAAQGGNSEEEIYN